MPLYKINISSSDDVANAEWNKEIIPKPIKAENGFQAVEIAKQILIDGGQFTAEEIENNLLFQIKYI